MNMTLAPNDNLVRSSLKKLDRSRTTPNATSEALFAHKSLKLQPKTTSLSFHV